MRELDEALTKSCSSGSKVSVSKGKFQPLEDMNVASALKMEVVRLTAENDILKSKLEGNVSKNEKHAKNREDHTIFYWPSFEHQLSLYFNYRKMIVCRERKSLKKIKLNYLKNYVQHKLKLTV